jgi:predicted Zn-dependent protease
MIGRILWFGLLALLAVVATAVQLDRQSARTPIIANSVPAPVRSFAQAQIAASYLRNGTASEALKEAELLVQRRPVPAENLRLLAQAQIAAGKAEQGFATIQIAAQRGWRDPAAQEAMLRIAIAAGDQEEAARRYTALFLKRGTQDALLEEFGVILFAHGESQAAQTMTQILAGTSRWNDTFLRRGVRVLPAQGFADILEAADAKGARFDCAVMEQASRQLASRDDAARNRLSMLVNRRCLGR